MNFRVNFFAEIGKNMNCTMKNENIKNNVTKI